MKIEDVIKVGCEHYGITVDQLMAKNRTYSITRRRNIIMLICHERLGSYYSELYSIFGFKCSTSAYYGCMKARDMINLYPKAEAHDYNEIIKRLDHVEKG